MPLGTRPSGDPGGRRTRGGAASRPAWSVRRRRGGPSRGGQPEAKQRQAADEGGDARVEHVPRRPERVPAGQTADEEIERPPDAVEEQDAEQHHARDQPAPAPQSEKRSAECYVREPWQIDQVPVPRVRRDEDGDEQRDGPPEPGGEGRARMVHDVRGGSRTQRFVSGGRQGEESHERIRMSSWTCPPRTPWRRCPACTRRCYPLRVESGVGGDLRAGGIEFCGQAPPRRSVPSEAVPSFPTPFGHAFRARTR
jgi:hypothetical protein